MADGVPLMFNDKQIGTVVVNPDGTGTIHVDDPDIRSQLVPQDDVMGISIFVGPQGEAYAEGVADVPEAQGTAEREASD